MPTIFVHGVNVRDSDPDYADGCNLRGRLYSTFCTPNLPPEFQSCGELQHVYWGNLGAKFRWNMVGLPKASDEHLGSKGFSNPHEQSVLQQDPLLMLDAMIAAQEPTGDLSQFQSLVSQLVENESGHLPPFPFQDQAAVQETPWDKLANLATPSSPGASKQTEPLGGGGRVANLRAMLEHAWIRLTGSPTKLAMGLIRPNLHKSAVGFMGDVLAMIGHREARDAAIAAIRNRIVNAKEQAKTEKTIVIAHSMGGILVADMLLRPDSPAIDLLVTVGSQIAPMAELGHLPHAAVDNLAPASSGKVGPGNKAILPSVKRWINVYAQADLLGFRAGEVFGNAEDFSFITGASPLSSHSDYFLRASFYTRLAKRILQGLPRS